MANEEYKFPDEDENAAKQQNDEPVVDVGVTEEGDVEIEVADDTPEEDRGRKPLDKVDEPTDEELTSYSSEVQQRIKHLTRARHDERRAKEAMAREREELERLTQKLLDENKKLKSYAAHGEKAYAGSLEAAATAELEMAKKKYKEAHEAFDADALLEAQEQFLQAQLKLQQAKNFKPSPSLQQTEESVETRITQQQRPQLDEKTLRWQEKNPWFGPDEEMTAVALVAHKKLVQSGVDPRSDEYFGHIDARIRKVFPDYFGEKNEPEKPVEVRKAATVVAPAKRSTGAKKVTLTKTQVAIAKRLNVPLELYAKQLAAQEAANG